jgi:type IV pilus biogenesis protein CpaD/CtpE
MDINVNVVITPSKEMIDLVERIFGAAVSNAPVSQHNVVIHDSLLEAAPAEDKPKQARKPKEKVVETPAPVVSAALEQAEAPAEEVKPTITIEMLQSIARGKSQQGKRDEVRALLNKYNAARVADVAIVDFEAFKNEVEAL